MRKIPKKILVLALLILIGLGFFVYSNYDKWFSSNKGGNFGGKVEFGNLEAISERKSFDSEIEIFGNTKIKNEQKIKFNTSGKITEVKFNVGDNVKKGDVIVAIDAVKAKSDIDKAYIELEKARRNFEKTVSDLKDSRLKSATLDLEMAKMSIEQKEKDLAYLKEKQNFDYKSRKNSLEVAKNTFIIDEARIKKELAVSKFDTKNSGNSLIERNISYDKQKREYEEFKNNFDSKLERKLNEYKLKRENTYYDLEKDIRDFYNTLREISDVLGITSGNFAYGDYFSAKNNLNLSKIREFFYKADQEYQKMKSSFKLVSGKDDNKNIIKTLEVGKNFYDNMYLALIYLEQGFTDSVEVEGFNPQSYFSRFSSALSKTSSMRGSILATIDELKNYESEEKIRKDLENDLEKARISLENTEIEVKKFIDEKDFTSNTTDASQKNLVISLDELKISLEQKILEFEKFEKQQQDEYRQAEISLEKEKIAFKSQEESYEKLRNLTKNDEYLSAQESLKQAELNLENSKKLLENFMIQAPFDGVITKMDYLVGDRITENSSQYISIVDPKTIEILVDINQTDIIKVKKGMKTKVILDSYPENILDGTIIELDTTPTTDDRTGLSKFSAKVLIGDYGDLKLFTGMQATVKIKVDTIPEGIVVPFSAVNSDEDGKKYVTVIENGKKVKKYVEVGFSDGQYYQITSGLKEDEKILEIDYDASKIKDEEEHFGGHMF